MTSSRWTSLGVVLLLGCAPLISLASCGTDQSTGSTGDDGGGGDDATTEGASGDDAAQGGDTGQGGDATVDRDGGGDGACVPVTSCPPTVTCGHYTDPCTGTTMVCGSPCPKGQVCSGTGNSQSCQAPACAGKCGVIGVDSCGVAIVCPGCTGGLDCVNNICVPPTDAGADAGGCSTLTCTPSPNTHLCGTVTDGCGNTLQCSCPTGTQCVGNICQATPLECDTDAGIKCGSTPNACGSGKVQCGNCTGTNTCTNGICTPCAPPSCNGATCGSVSNGCGPAVSCGTCSGSETCADGGCCTPSTCAAAIDAGLVTGCSPIDLGCGVKKDCSPCPGTDVCLPDGGCCAPSTCAAAIDAGLVIGCTPVDLGCGMKKDCSPCPGTDVCLADGGCAPCVPKTCADFANDGCSHNAGCGVVLNCCAAGTTCQNGLCCPPGEIDFQNTCCKPQCDPNLPPGPQISCGQTILCGKG